MPVYEYQCQQCGKELEVTQRITDESLKICPSCGGALQKLISNTSFILKGTGWYVTDYARKGSSQGKTTGRTSDTKSTSGEKKDASNDKKETTSSS
jgi:putative FmdB family regulatory protein